MKTRSSGREINGMEWNGMGSLCSNENTLFPFKDDAQSSVIICFSCCRGFRHQTSQFLSVIAFSFTFLCSFK